MPDIIFDSKTFFVVSIAGKVAEAVGEFTFSVAQAPKSLDKFNIQAHNQICKQICRNMRCDRNKGSLITAMN